MRFLPFVALLTGVAACSGSPPVPLEVSRRPWGEVDGRRVELFVLARPDGASVEISEFGGAIVSLRVPDRRGELADVVLGFSDLDSYVADTNPYFGAIVGRYANRVAGGRFSLDGATYDLPRNDGENSLHGGARGLTRVVWQGEPFASEAGSGVELRYRSPDGEEGYPGNVDFLVRYTLLHGAEGDGYTLRIEAEAVTDRPTVVNLSFHSYFNLSGEGEGDVLDHRLLLNGRSFTPVDESLIPTGEIAPVVGTPMDFSEATEIGERIDDDFEQLLFGGGYDHNWVLAPRTAHERGAGPPGAGSRAGAGLEHELRLAAVAVHPSSGRTLRVRTTAPGLQFYSGNFLDGTLVGKSGRPYVRRGGFCLETQHFPDSPNQPAFPTTVLRPGQTYRQVTEYGFTSEG